MFKDDTKKPPQHSAVCSYHRILRNAVVVWGDDSGAEFTFLRKRSERME